MVLKNFLKITISALLRRSKYSFTPRKLRFFTSSRLDLEIFRKLLIRKCLSGGLFLSFLLTLLGQYGFVLLSGPDEATLPVSPDAPTLSFIWDGQSPGLKDKGDYQGGIYEGLQDEQVMAALIQDAMNLWNNVYGSYLIMQLEGISAAAQLDRDDQLFSIVVLNESNQSSAASASPVVEEKQITDCDIKIASRSTSVSSLAFTIAHELGHCVGLGHNHTNYKAIMGYSRSNKQLKLGADDISGIIYLYPDPAVIEKDSQELISCASIGHHSLKNSPPAQWIWILVLMSAPLYFSTRKALTPYRK